MPVGDLGVAEIMPCVEDPALPGLRSVLEALEGPRVVRYHPGSRCIVHGGLGPAGRYVKVFARQPTTSGRHMTVGRPRPPEPSRSPWPRLAAGLRPDDWDRAARALEEVEVALRTLASHL